MNNNDQEMNFCKDCKYIETGYTGHICLDSYVKTDPVDGDKLYRLCRDVRYKDKECPKFVKKESPIKRLWSKIRGIKL